MVQNSQENMGRLLGKLEGESNKLFILNSATDKGLKDLEKRVELTEKVNTREDLDIEELKNRLKALADRLDALPSAPVVSSGPSDADLADFLKVSVFTQEREKIDQSLEAYKDWVAKNFVQIPTFKDYSSKTDMRIDSHDKRFFEINDSLRTHMDQIRKLDDTKADKRDLEALKKFIQSAISQQGSSMDFKGMDDLAELMKRLDDLEHALKLCLTQSDKKEITNNLEDLWKAVREISGVKLPQMNADIASNTTAVKEALEGVNRLEDKKLDKSKFDQLWKLFEGLQKQVDGLNSGPRGSDSSDEILKLWEAIEALRKALDEHITRTNDSFRDIHNELKKKCTFDSLEELRVTLNGELDSLKEQVDHKLDLKADKDWVAKMLRKLQEMIETMRETHVDSEDAMFSKKPLLNSFCASCDADLKGLRGVRAE